MSDEQFRQMCNTFGFAPSRALREMLDAVAGQARIAEREESARVAERFWLQIDGQTNAPQQITEGIAAAIRARGKQ